MFQISNLPTLAIPTNVKNFRRTLEREVKMNSYSNLDSLFQPTSSSADDNNTTSGLFSHLQAEALLQRIINAVEKHEVECKSFERNNVQVNETLQQLTRKMMHLQELMNSTNQRLDAVENAIHVKDNDLTVGECVAANRRTLVRTLNLVSAKVDAAELMEAAEAQNEHLESTLQDFRRDVASNDAMHKTNDAITSLVNRIEVMSDDVRNKVDKTLFKALSSEAAALQNYALFVKKTESTLKLLEETLESHDNVHKVLSKRSDGISEEIEGCPTLIRLQQVEGALEGLSQHMNNKVDAEVLQSLSQDAASIKDRMKSITDDTSTLFASHETLAKHFTKRLDNTYTKAAIDKSLELHVEKDEFNDVLGKMQQDIKRTQQKSDLAAQFIALYDEQEE
eukprot:scaffold797_cov408-Chaetoceros_neogracile.AAC.66